jgi:hypothetical protein
MATGKGGEQVNSTSINSLRPNELHFENAEIKRHTEIEKRVMRKIDFWLVGFYSFVYIFRIIDSSNYSNAAIINLEAGTGIKKELGLNPSQWPGPNPFSHTVTSCSNRPIQSSSKASSRRDGCSSLFCPGEFAHAELVPRRISRE